MPYVMEHLRKSVVPYIMEWRECLKKYTPVCNSNILPYWIKIIYVRWWWIEIIMVDIIIFETQIAYVEIEAIRCISNRILLKSTVCKCIFGKSYELH